MQTQKRYPSLNPENKPLNSLGSGWQPRPLNFHKTIQLRSARRTVLRTGRHLSPGPKQFLSNHGAGSYATVIPGYRLGRRKTLAELYQFHGEEPVSVFFRVPTRNDASSELVYHMASSATSKRI